MAACLPRACVQRRGRKAVVVDPALTPALSSLDGALPDLLAEHGVARWVGRVCVWATLT